jgi:hypothetical protein
MDLPEERVDVSGGFEYVKIFSLFQVISIFDSGVFAMCFCRRHLPSNQPVFLLIICLSVMKIIEDSFINLILPLFQAQMLNSLICRRDISQSFFQQQKYDTNPFPSQEKFEDALNSNSTFCSA